MRIATYNVHRCVGADGHASIERVADVLREIGPDVVGLQEVISSERIPHAGQLERLADAAGFVPVAGGTLVEEDAQYGNGILTRRPIADVRRHDLSVPGREPRGAIEVVVETDWGRARVINVHLGLRGRERRRQIARLNEVVDATPEPVLALMGDVNEWRRGPFVNPLRSLPLHPAPVARTFPATRPLIALDRIWVDARFAIRASGRHDTPLARSASDHLPFTVELANVSFVEPD